MRFNYVCGIIRMLVLCLDYYYNLPILVYSRAGRGREIIIKLVYCKL